MIEDEELRIIFKQECEEHLQRLDEGLLVLEKSPGDSGTLEEVFREAHSLKGSARMLHVTGVETLAHWFEDRLGAAKRGEEALASEVIDRLYRNLDQIRKLVHESVTGEDAGIDVQAVLADLESSVESENEDPDPEIETDLVHTEPELTAAPESTPQAKAGIGDTYRIETIRVEPRRLDVLVRQAGELVVTNLLMERRMNQIDDLVSQWEDWQRKCQVTGLRAETDVGVSLQDQAATLGDLLQDLRSSFYDDMAKLDSVTKELDEGIRTIRLLPLSTIFNLFPRTVRDLARAQEKEVRLVSEGGDHTADKLILEELKDPLMHMIRNAVDHGIEMPEVRQAAGKPTEGTITLRASQEGAHVIVEVSDDGGGLDLDAIKATALRRNVSSQDELDAMSNSQIREIIFAPGFSTSTIITDVSGRGVGMDVVRSNVERLKGTIEVASSRGDGCTVRIRVPVSLATTRVLTVSAGNRLFALPVDYVRMVMETKSEDIYLFEGRETVLLDGVPLGLSNLQEVLGIPLIDLPGGKIEKPSLVVVTNGEEDLGILVDRLLDEQEVVAKPLGVFLKRVRNVSGATILETGEICIVLNVPDLIKSSKEMSRTQRKLVSQEGTETDAPPVLLLVEDSITTRAQERRILEGAGYEVVTAVDGLDGINKLAERVFDGVVSDVEMPNLDGLSFTERIRQDERYRDLPVVLVTSLASDADRKRGIEVGANAYITKSGFDQKALLETLKRLV
jgi:two-component system chemotaxis sensor kinase CheA